MIEISKNATLDELQQALVLISSGAIEVSNTQLNAIKALIALRVSEMRMTHSKRNQALMCNEDKDAFNII